jgi:hypothetical protein
MHCMGAGVAAGCLMEQNCETKEPIGWASSTLCIKLAAKLVVHESAIDIIRGDAAIRIVNAVHRAFVACHRAEHASDDSALTGIFESILCMCLPTFFASVLIGNDEWVGAALPFHSMCSRACAPRGAGESPLLRHPRARDAPQRDAPGGKLKSMPINPLEEDGSPRATGADCVTWLISALYIL